MRWTPDYLLRLSWGAVCKITQMSESVSASFSCQPPEKPPCENTAGDYPEDSQWASGCVEDVSDMRGTRNWKKEKNQTIISGVIQVEDRVKMSKTMTFENFWIWEMMPVLMCCKYVYYNYNYMYVPPPDATPHLNTPEMFLWLWMSLTGESPAAFFICKSQTPVKVQIAMWRLPFGICAWKRLKTDGGNERMWMWKII